jgi:hypothetical protein
MDEARRVIERLERIDALKGSGVGARDLLAEVRLLLAEGERWLAAERAVEAGLLDLDGVSTERAGVALSRCRSLVDNGAAAPDAEPDWSADADARAGDSIRREVVAGVAV